MTDSGYPTEFLPDEPGRKYDGGGRPSPLLLPMMCEGVRLVESFGASRIASYCEPLTERIAGLDFPRFLLIQVDCAHHHVGSSWLQQAAPSCVLSVPQVACYPE